MAKRKFKAIEKDVKDAPVKDIEWEGEEVGAVAKKPESQISFDQGTGQPIILRFFDFASNVEAFREHRPTAQELFDSHIKGIETMIWADGLSPCTAIEPRIMFSKDKSHYRFVVSCIPSLGNTLVDKSKTLTQLINETS